MLREQILDHLLDFYTKLSLNEIFLSRLKIVRFIISNQWSNNCYEELISSEESSIDFQIKILISLKMSLLLNHRLYDDQLIESDYWSNRWFKNLDHLFNWFIFIGYKYRDEIHFTLDEEGR
jgi:hypothetical protein